MSETGEEHKHLLGRGVLGLVENDEGVVERPSAHVGQRSDFDRAAFHVLLDFLAGKHVMQRVVEWAKVRRDFFVEVAGQKTERFAGFHRRASQNNARNFLLLERLNGHRHRQISLAGAGGTDGERHVVMTNRLHVFFLADCFRRDRGLFGRGLDPFVQQALEHGCPFVFNHVEGVSEFTVAHGRAGFQRTFQQ